MAAVKYMSKEEGKANNISELPNFHKSGSVEGMKKLYYGKDALLVQCGNYIYNVTYTPKIYIDASDEDIRDCGTFEEIEE